MKRLNLVVSCLATILAASDLAAVRADSITYDIVDYPTIQNGYTINGTITTDGKLGNLTSSDITAWSISISGGVWPSPVTQANGQLEVLDQPANSMGLQATTAGIELQSGGPNELFFWPNANDQNILFWGNWANNGSPFADFGLEASPGHFPWDADDQRVNGLSTMAAPDNANNILIASPAPEPSTFTLLGISAIGVFAYTLRRRWPKSIESDPANRRLT